MKRKLGSIFAILVVLAAGACMGGKAMEVTYTAKVSGMLNNATVYLEVNDARPVQELVGPSAREQGLFEELRNGRFDLVTDLPNGSRVTMTNLTVKEAVREAVARRLQAMGVTASSQPAANRINVVVSIDQFSIDVDKGDLLANVYVNYSIYRTQDKVFKANNGTQSTRMKLIGGTGGSKVFSDALTQTLNDLDFTPINKL